ncbi:MAG: winged helix-turn-helix domain-containing protein [Halioglobus sp.]
MTGSMCVGDWVWNPNTLELRHGSYIVTLEPRVAQLFEYMVAHPGELLSRDRLVDEVWDGRVVSDEAVRRAVFNLRQAFAVAGAGDFIRTVHKKGYVATFPIPVPVADEALAEPTLAPPVAATPAGVENSAQPAQPIAVPAAKTAQFARRLILPGIVVAIALGVALLPRFGVWQEREPAPAATEVPAQAPAFLAVLPIINLSGETDSGLLADGLTEALFGALERNPGLRITARSSAFQFKDQQRDVREVGRLLGVRYVLEGSVLSQEEKVQVQTRLVDTHTGTQLWSETYDRAQGDWFALQQDIAVDATRAVQFALQKENAVVDRPGRVSNEEAQLELLQARQLLITRSVADAEQAIEHLQRALTLDPNYALAYARLADAILIQAESTTGIKAARPVVAPLLEKALALDPGLGEAYALRSRLTDKAAAAERDLRRGLELNPSYARGYEMLAALQTRSPQLMEAAEATIDHAIALDPLTPGNYHTKAVLMMTQGNWPEVVALDRRALELNPQFRAALLQLGSVSAVQGKFADAIDYGEQALALDPRAVVLHEQLTLLYLAIGDLETVRAINTPSTPSSQLAMLFAQGSNEQAAEMIYNGELGLLENSSPNFLSQIVLRQALTDGNFTRALDLLTAAFPFVESLPPEVIGWRLYAYANLKQLLDASGDTSTASRLQEQMEQRMKSVEARYPRYSLISDQVQATLLAHEGRREEACAALERAYTPAPRAYWGMVLNNPGFDGMRDTPCFQTLLVRFEAYMAVERARVDEMRRTGQIPDRSAKSPEEGAAGAL